MWQDALTLLVMSIPLLCERYSPRSSLYSSVYWTTIPRSTFAPIDTAFVVEFVIVCLAFVQKSHDNQLPHESSIDGAQRLIEGWLSSVPMSIAMSEESSVREAEEIDITSDVRASCHMITSS